MSKVTNNMHLNGDSMESFPENQEMLDAENRDMVDRLTDLERKVLEQGDELMCLKSTLAEALRRLSVLEGLQINNHSGSIISPINRNKELQISSNGSRLNKLRPVMPSKEGVVVDNNNRSSSGSSGNVGSPGNRRPLFAGSSLPQRRSVHYQSTGSLHSDSHSSSSVSPAPSPSPRATPQPLTTTTNNNNNNGNLQHRKTPPTSSPSPVGNLHKRWSSTGDFIQNNLVSSQMHSKYSTKSFLNLYSKSNNYHTMSNFKHGTKEATYNEDEKYVKMYLRGRPVIFYTPTDCTNYDISKVNVAPQRKLKLDWVYGYRGRDCRSNLYILPTGEMVYFVASIVVLYNVEEQCQRHYLGHTNDVKSLAIHPSKMLIATGQCGGIMNRDHRDESPHIRVWNSVSLHTQAIIGINDFDVSICCLSFSKSDGGTLLLAVDETNDHTISVWEWQKGENGHKLTEAKCSVDTIVAAEFHPLDRNTLVTCGKSHIAFWSIDVNGTLFKKIGIFETRDKPKYVTCVNFLQTGETITGDSNGNLAVWGRGTNTIIKLIKNVHEGPIFTICVLKDGSVISGGGKDGRIVQFNSNLHKNFDESQIEGHFGGIRVVSEGRGSQLIVGTTRNCILNGTIELGFQPIVLGHTEEIWGLASHPNIQQFATAGYDKVLQLWDALSHNILWSKDIGETAQSLAFSIDGTCVVVGCTSGKWMMFDTQTRELIAHHVDGSEPIQVVEFSPDGLKMALGSRDNNIYIYEIAEDSVKFNRIGKCMGHSSFITHLDWSQNSDIIRSNSGDYELLYWNASTCRQITQANAIRDVKWATNKCTLTFQTIGIWPENIDGSDINCCDRSHNLKLLASGDDFGKIKLFNYPASQTKSLCHTYGGHSSHVTGINFLHDDTRLISIGGKDTAVLQWIVS